MKKRRNILILWFMFIFYLFFVGTFLVSPVYAQGLIQVKIIERNNLTEAEFWIRGKLLGRLPQGKDAVAFNSRIDNWSRRLEEVFGNNTKPQSITAKEQAGQGLVLMGSTTIITIDKETATLKKTTPLKMAEEWAKNIRFALLNAPSFKLESNSITIPLNENISMKFQGNFAGEPEFIGYDGETVDISCDKGNKTINFYGKQLGSGTMWVKAEDIERTLNYVVRERAGYVPQYINMQVTGDPSLSDFWKRALESIIYYRSSPKPDAYVIIGKEEKGDLKELKVNRQATLIIPAKVDGPAYIPSKEKINLTLENISYTPPKPDYLFISNHPETVIKDGELFSADLAVKSSARLFYHHKNAPHTAWKNLYMVLENNGSQPTTVYLTNAVAGPSNDEMFVGHLAASLFFQYQEKNMGWFVTIKPGTAYIIEKRLMKSNQTVSGVGYIYIREGNNLTYRVYAETIPGKPEPEGVAEYVENPNIIRSKGIFEPFIKLTPSHKIGGNYTFIYLGDKPYQQELNDQSPNYGNYGVVYNIDIAVENPWQDARPAWIYFVPGGGPARGTFFLDGTLMETPLGAPSQKILIKKLMVAPGKTESVKLETMPQGGTFYPVKIVVESEFVKPEGGNEGK